MNDLKNKLQIIQKELAIIMLKMQTIIDKDRIINISNVKHNSQYELIKDLMHILNTAINVLDTILYLQNSE